MLSKKRVVVAMSGGVDSSIVAYLLVKEKYEVLGVNLQLFRAEESTRHTRRTEDARDVCQKLGIPFYTFDYKKEFQEKVIKYFCREYENGRTPNPCIICNSKIKFGSLLKKAKSLGAKYIATGHYAKIEYDAALGRYILKKGKDKKRDQSYFLFSLSQEQMKHTLFPLGDYTKEEVRKLAQKLGLKVHDEPASQDVCFIPDADYHKFLRKYLNNEYKLGLILDGKGRAVGKHKGIAFYTVGQRKGLGPHGKPMYVIRIDKNRNIIVIGREKELYKDVLTAEKVNWIDREGLTEPLKMKTRIRYKHKETEALIFPLEDGLVRVKFNRPQRAITPGQAVVFYNRDKVIGGGWIT